MESLTLSQIIVLAEALDMPTSDLIAEVETQRA